MNNLNSLQEIARAIRNLIRTGIVTDVDHDEGLCRVQTGGMETTWLNWLTCRAGRSRVWWAPSVGEQVLLLAVGGELDTAFVLPGIFSDDHPAPSASPDALHVSFPDGAVIEYEPETGALTVSGIKTADVTASDSITAAVPVVLVKAETRITLDTPEVVCTNKLTTGTLEVKNGGTMRGNIEHTGGTLKSNGVQVDNHAHGNVQSGGSWTSGGILIMGYVYRASSGGFYCDELEAEYRKAGTWPGFFVRVSDEDYRNLMEGVSQGKMIVPNKQCYPVLQERPAPSRDELIAEAEEKRRELIESALQSISVIQLKQMNGRSLTEKEVTRLNDVLDYIEALEATETDAAPDIHWPELAA
ncbi:TPA: phage baseplate assembly protein V [Enterobacter roggenkampii]|nr:phage baseplate assembly protein V [Enterobacter roggenkampii]HEM8095641.1 phage baseplate assembly protein V [Enterobacter roggenkampii]HEM8105766.1 phage baseplate assembly protein V [Enterobacter roggenkampii]HEM8115480.1 phage baseplate assembly protein V [Enterobacter roggenkampii]